MKDIPKFDILLKGFIRLFYFFILFPYINIVPLATDTQPYALILATILLLFFFILDEKINCPIEIMLIIPTLFSAILFGIFEFSFNSIRSMVNYISLFCISLATYNVLKIERKFPVWLLKSAIWIWLIIGLVQKFIYSEFMTFLLFQARGINLGGRGVVGLAPEPTFYGIMCIFLLLLNYLCNNNDRVLKWILIFQIVYLSMSSLAILFGIIFCFYYVVILALSLRFKRKNIILTLILFLLMGIFVSSLDIVKDARIGRIISLSIDDPSYIFLIDRSGNDRLAHMFFPMLAMFKNHFLPHGFDAWNTQVQLLASEYGEYFQDISTDSRIMSGYGAAFFELGFLGMFVPLSLTLAVYNYFKPNLFKFFLFAFFLNTIMFSAIQLSLPFVGFLLGFLAFFARNRSNSSLGVKAS